jgi:hypothetical protein
LAREKGIGANYECRLRWRRPGSLLLEERVPRANPGLIDVAA